MNEKLKKITVAVAIGASALSLNACAESKVPQGNDTKAPSIEQIVDSPNNRLEEAGIIFLAGSLIAGTIFISSNRNK